MWNTSWTRIIVVIVLLAALTATGTATATSFAIDPSATPEPVVFRVIPAATIPDSGIDEHIPRGADPSDREIVREVLRALAPSERQFVFWLRVPPGKDGYKYLPNHGLMVMYNENALQNTNAVSARLAGAGYVLYFDGRVHLDSQFAYGSSLSKYLTPVFYRFDSKRRLLFRAISALRISNNQIDAHIPADADPTDRKIVRKVLEALPPTKRQYIVWVHVLPGKPGYEEFPNHGLVVMYFSNDNPGVQLVRAQDLPGLYVLYFDGKVQLDANLIYASTLDSYLTVVPTGFSFEVLQNH